MPDCAGETWLTLLEAPQGIRAELRCLSLCPMRGSALAEGQLGTETLEEISSEERILSPLLILENGVFIYLIYHNGRLIYE